MTRTFDRRPRTTGFPAAPLRYSGLEPYGSSAASDRVTGGIRILVVDDNEFIRLSLKRAIDGAPEMVVVGECSDGDQVAGVAALVSPDVVLMDVSMPVMSGLEAARGLALSQPKIRVLMLTALTDRRTVARAAAVGAAGYLIKDGNGQALLGAVRAVAEGGSVWPATPSSRSGNNTV